MAESAALLVDEVLPHEPIRQWVLSFPFQLRFLSHLKKKDGLPLPPDVLPETRVPPQTSLFA
jgi:hypothetical protein